MSINALTRSLVSGSPSRVRIPSAMGTASAVSGVGRGVRILSECNVWASLGLLILFLALQRFYIRGMLAGSVKG